MPIARRQDSRRPNNSKFGRLLCSRRSEPAVRRGAPDGRREGPPAWGAVVMTERMAARQARQPLAAAARAAANRAAPAGRDGAAVRLPSLYDRRLDRDSCGVGFIADLKGRKSRRIVEDGLQILENLTHRGAVGADPLVGDGAGLLVQIPHEFFAAECAGLGFDLPEPGDYGVGFLFMPRD